ncbi:MAG: TldD/PmbA family protein [Armatimonadota bacterium]|nr:TldD/PmbA family protein [Armatimonadota bacterium]MDR5696956.1 TldD/PmbA family protein [Armatimonadota bacterium]
MTLDEARRYVLERARRRGIQAEVLGLRDRELTLRAHGGRLEQLTRATQAGVGIRVVVRERVGYAYSEHLSPEALDWVLQEAEENAALQHEAVGFLPEGTDLGEWGRLGQSFDASMERKQQATLDMEAGLRADPRTHRVPAAIYTEREREVSLGSTEGAAGRYRTGVAGIGATVVMREGDSIKQSADMDWSVRFDALDPGRTSLRLVERTARLLDARPLRTGRYVAYFEPKAFAQLLWAFWPLWSGKAVVEGKSRLVGRLGERIASELVTLVDDPTLPEGLASRPFDAEGTSARPVVLVERGVLCSYLTNSQTAHALEHPNTGHASRGYRGVLGVAPTNLYVKPADGLRRERGVVVTELMGVHAGANPITGEFSVQGLGLWVDGGEVVHAVEDFAIAGDFLALLERVGAVGTDLDWWFAGTAFGAPTVEVGDLSFAGGE